LVHCDLAEKEKRSPPGVNEENFVPYLQALKKVNYKGKIILECQWTNLTEQGKPALKYLQKQLAEAYK
jgi:hydroxypyruvate isomerase